MSDEKKPAKVTTKTVIWTDKGEKDGAHSEHGKHVAGEKVETEHAALLIERGFAKPSS